MIPSPRSLRAAASNAAHMLLYGHVADLRPMPAVLLDDGPKGAVYRYRAPEGVVPAGPPVLFVPPLAAPARCYDLRRGCSLAEHVVTAGRTGYLLDYGPVSFADRRMGFTEWVRGVLPDAIRTVSADSGGQPVQLVGWCLGGILSLLAAADDPGLPIASVAVIAAPVDMSAVRLAAPLRPLTRVPGLGTGVVGAFDAVFGGLPRPLVKRAYQVIGADKYLLRPYKVLANLDDREFLAQIEAVDHFTNSMLAYPGNTARDVYRELLRDNALSGDGVRIGSDLVPLGGVKVPVLAIAGRGDGLAPVRSVRPLTRLLAGAPEVRFAAAPGGHLGVLTGRSARATTWAHLDRWLDEGTVRHGIRVPRRQILA
ncbi:alpha/beta fold hydrolase [Actinomadura rupiterrae]|uniref:alpha/beta fold hydrolase n=1 Tax=Actinomadura rupiterrae TaxID=559627 RepID=UPI0020A383E4|nr:alpha/beta fold hydrolase [Actinomadura rupiterrae]MCP2335771.1 polyhydroxyalkanoate synthase [Actinomadura rupiterrae]